MELFPLATQKMFQLIFRFKNADLENGRLQHDIHKFIRFDIVENGHAIELIQISFLVRLKMPLIMLQVYKKLLDRLALVSAGSKTLKKGDTKNKSLKKKNENAQNILRNTE